MSTATTLTWAHIRSRSHKYDALTALILIYLANRTTGGVASYTTPGELAGALGFATSTIGERLAKLRNAGVIVRPVARTGLHRLSDELIGI